jgi:hypothetical protein
MAWPLSFVDGEVKLAGNEYAVIVASVMYINPFMLCWCDFMLELEY